MLGDSPLFSALLSCFPRDQDVLTRGLASQSVLLFLLDLGIEANPDKIQAIERMEAPKRVKDVQAHNGCITTLGRFISRLGERALPFLKLLKKSGPVQWTPKAEEALQSLKSYLASPPILVAPVDKDPYCCTSLSLIRW